MALIDIDYRDTLRKAERLESLARELRNVSSRDLQELQSGGGRAWSGSASEMYRKRARTLSQKTAQQAKDLEKLARSLREAAERYRMLEMAANAIFRN